jgi:hypothetical protein
MVEGEESICMVDLCVPQRSLGRLAWQDNEYYSGAPCVGVPSF